MITSKSVLRWLLALSVGFGLAFGLTTQARAFELDNDGTIPADEVVDDDLFIGGQRVVIDGTVNGDVFAFGQTVTVNGTINGSLFTGAQFIVINGEVTGSVYGGSNSIEIGSGSAIGRNAYYMGYSLRLADGASLGRDLAFMGYQALLRGSVGRDVHVAGGALEISGAVGGDVKANIGAPNEVDTPMPYMAPGAPLPISPGIHIRESAEIGGVVEYTSPVEQAKGIATSPGGGVVYHKLVTEKGQVKITPAMRTGLWALDRLRELVTLLVLGALALWKLPNLFGRVKRTAAEQPLTSISWGFMTILVGYLGAAVLAGILLAVVLSLGMLTLGKLSGVASGIGFSSLILTLAVFSLLVGYGSKLVLAAWGGEWLLNKVAAGKEVTPFWTLALGLLIYVLLHGIPYLGGVIAAVVTLMGAGAMWLTYREECRGAEASPLPAE